MKIEINIDERTKLICHGCGALYDAEIGHPTRCPCGKIIRHKITDEEYEEILKEREQNENLHTL